MQVRVRFKAQGANSIIGGFAHGDIARVSKEIADHFVEIGVAEYADKQEKQEEKHEVKRGRKPKESI